MDTSEEQIAPTTTEETPVVVAPPPEKEQDKNIVIPFDYGPDIGTIFKNNHN